MLRAYKYRLYPTVKQSILLDQHFAACRLVYNLGLEVKTYAYSAHGIFLNKYDLQKQLPELKQHNDWMLNVNSQSLQASLLNLDNAFTSFYKKNTAFPKYKSKRKSKASAEFPQANKLVNNKLILRKFQEGIKIIIDRQPVGELRNVIVSKTPTGKYFASITYETGADLPKKILISPQTAVGIDLGIKDFAVLSDGRKFANPKFLKQSQSRLKVLQRRLSRKKKGSNRYRLQKYKIALQHEKIANQRKDFQHKLSREIINQYDTLCFETLRIENMIKNHSLAGSISDAAW